MICVEKGKNMHSNQARLAGDFMRQKWRIYGNSYKVAWLNVLAATGIIKIPHPSRVVTTRSRKQAELRSFLAGELKHVLYDWP